MRRKKADPPAGRPETARTSAPKDPLAPNCKLLTPADATVDLGPMPNAFLRCLRDGDGSLTAGLKPTAVTASQEHWNDGVRLTDVCDERMVDALVTERGGNDDDRCTALLGIAWRRMHLLVKRPIRCWRPPELRPFTVRMRPDGGPEGALTVIEVMAGSETAACAAAAAAVFDHAGPTAEATVSVPRATGDVSNPPPRE